MSLALSAPPIAPSFPIPPVHGHPLDSSRVLMGLVSMNRMARNSHVGENPSVSELIVPEILQLLFSALHCRDVRTARHARRVAAIASGLAEHVGLEGRVLRAIEITGLVHDLGKIGVPDTVLHKPGRLGNTEEDLLDAYQRIAVDLLRSCCVATEITTSSREMIKSLVDTLTSSPSRESIPTKFVRVADAVDSLRTDQVYRKGRSSAEILDILQQNAGPQFDADVVAAFVNWTQEIGAPQGTALSPDLSFLDAIEQSPQEASAWEANLIFNLFTYLYMLETMYDGYCVVDSERQVVSWSNGLERMSGLRADEVLHQSWGRHLFPVERARSPFLEETEFPVPTVLASGRQVLTLGKLVRAATGEKVDVEVQSIPIIDDQGRVKGVVEIYRDPRSETEDAASSSVVRDLKAAATRDPLTGLFNRGELSRQFTVLNTEFQDRGCQDGLSVIFLDIDHFKSINDTFGHAVGDIVLSSVARLLQQETYSGEVVARYGGEEFVLLCPGTDLKAAVRKADRLRNAIERLRIEALPRRNVTSSFGAASVFPNESMKSVFERADGALYRAKQEGRNRTRWSDGTEFNTQTANGISKMENKMVNRQYITRLQACLSPEVLPLKLSAFIQSTRAKLIKAEPSKFVLQMGKTSWFPRWSNDPNRIPVRIELESKPLNRRESDGNARKNGLVLLTVTITPREWSVDMGLYEERCKAIVQRICTYLMAERSTEDSPDSPIAALGH